MSKSLAGVVVAVDYDGKVTAGQCLYENSPEEWQEAERWIEPRGRSIVRLIPMPNARPLKIGTDLADLLNGGWQRLGRQ